MSAPPLGIWRDGRLEDRCRTVARYLSVVVQQAVQQLGLHTAVLEGGPQVPGGQVEARRRPGGCVPESQQVFVCLEQEGGPASQGVGQALAGAGGGGAGKERQPVENGLVVSLQSRVVVTAEKIVPSWIIPVRTISHFKTFITGINNKAPTVNQQYIHTCRSEFSPYPRVLVDELRGPQPVYSRGLLGDGLVDQEHSLGAAGARVKLLQLVPGDGLNNGGNDWPVLHEVIGFQQLSLNWCRSSPLLLLFDFNLKQVWPVHDERVSQPF